MGFINKNLKYNVSKPIIMIIVILAFLNSCEKENVNVTKPTGLNSFNISKKSKNKFVLKSALPNLEVDENGVLVFDDQEELQSYFDWSETETENYINAFLSNYNDIEGDDLAYSLFEAGFDSEKPLKLFEENLVGYNSLRKKIEIEMQPYLELEDFDITETPEAHFVNNPYIRTILNEDCAYRVGDTTYFILEEGVIAMAPQADYNKLADDISNGVPIEDLVGPYVRILVVVVTNGGGGGSSCTDCRTNRYKMIEKTTGNKKYYVSLGLLFSGVSTTITARVKSYGRVNKYTPWFAWPYTKNVTFNTVAVYTGSSCYSYGFMQGKTLTSSVNTIISRTDWGDAARRVKCNTLSATGSASSLSSSTVTIGW